MFLKFCLFWSYLNAFEYIKFSDLNQTLEDFLKDSWKILRGLLEKSSNAFYARRRSTKSSGSFPKFVYAEFSDMSSTLENFSENSWKTLRNCQKTLGRLKNLGRLLADFLGSLLMYFMLGLNPPPTLMFPSHYFSLSDTNTKISVTLTCHMHI